MDIVQGLARAHDHGGQGVVNNRDGQGGFLAQELIETFEQRAAAREHDAAVHDVPGQFRRGLLQGDAHRLDNGFHLLGDGLAHLFGSDDDVLRDAGNQVAAFDFHFLFRVHGVGRGHFDFDFLGRGIANEHVVLAFDVSLDGFVHLVSGYAHGFGIDNAREGNDGHFRGAAADVHHHVGSGFVNGQIGANGRGHGFLNEVNFPRARALGRFFDRAFFHLGDARGHADHNAGPHQAAGIVYFGNKVAQHGFGDFKIRDNAVLHGADGVDIARGTAEHALGVGTHGQDHVVAAVVFFYGHHGRFAQDNAFALYIHAGVGGAKVNGQVIGKNAQKGIK